MTTPAAQYGDNSLDISVDSVQIKARKGETIIFEYSFSQPDTTDAAYDENDPDTWIYVPVNVTTWTFEGGVRDGSRPGHLAMDLVTLTGGNNNIVQVSFDSSTITTNVSANSTRDFYFEISATIPTTRVDSSGSVINVKKTALAGVLTLAADLYIAPITA